MALRLSEGLGSTGDDRFYSMTVWVDHEAGVVVGAIFWPWPGTTVVLAPVKKRLLVELMH